MVLYYSAHMEDYRSYFKGKRITLLGLGLLGRGVNDAKFLARSGAHLLVTDLKIREELNDALVELAPYKSISYVLGEHRLEDFRDCDMVLRTARVPLDSPFLAEARKNKIPIEMDASLFVKRARGVRVIGVTGTRGKSTTTHLIYHILKKAKRRVHLGGNIRGLATLPLLAKVRPRDTIVLELDSWQLQGFGDAKISPHIAVFTNFFDDHLDYYRGSRVAYFKDKANIFRFQNESDLLIAGNVVGEKIVKKFPKLAQKVSLVNGSSIPRAWQLVVPGEHYRENVACAVAVARALKIPPRVIANVVATFRGVPGRLEYLKKVKGVAVYNDTCATTPDATLAAIRALGKNNNIVLIMGGSDKKLNMQKLIRELSTYCRAVVLLAGSGTERIAGAVCKTKDREVRKAECLSEAVAAGFSLAQKGDVLLFSPAFASFGMFKNEYDRGDQFTALIKKQH